MTNEELRNVICGKITDTDNIRMKNIGKHPEFDLLDMLLSEYQTMLKAIDRVIQIEKEK